MANGTNGNGIHKTRDSVIRTIIEKTVTDTIRAQLDIFIKKYEEKFKIYDEAIDDLQDNSIDTRTRLTVVETTLRRDMWWIGLVIAGAAVLATIIIKLI